MVEQSSDWKAAGNAADSKSIRDAAIKAATGSELRSGNTENNAGIDDLEKMNLEGISMKKESKSLLQEAIEGWVSLEDDIAKKRQ